MSWVVWKTSSLGQTDRLYLNPPLSLTLCGFTVVSSSVKCWLRTRQECSGERGTLCSRVSLRQVTPSPLLPISEWKADPSRDLRGLQQSVTASVDEALSLREGTAETGSRLSEAGQGSANVLSRSGGGRTARRGRTFRSTAAWLSGKTLPYFSNNTYPSESPPLSQALYRRLSGPHTTGAGSGVAGTPARAAPRRRPPRGPRFRALSRLFVGPETHLTFPPGDRAFEEDP